MEDDVASLMRLRAELIEVRQMCRSKFVHRSIDAAVADLDGRLNCLGEVNPVFIQAGIDAEAASCPCVAE